MIVLDNLANSSLESLRRVESICAKPTFIEGDIRDRALLTLFFSLLNRRSIAFRWIESGCTGLIMKITSAAVLYYFKQWLQPVYLIWCLAHPQLCMASLNADAN